MKKILISLISIFLITFSFVNVSNAAEGDTNTTSSSESTTITVTVTEKIPGADCDNGTTKGSTTTYKCTVTAGFGTVMKMMQSMIKYFAFIASLGGVLFIVYNGIMYSMGGIEQGLKDNAKKRIIQTLLGLLVLFLSGVILNLVAPWIYTA